MDEVMSCDALIYQGDRDYCIQLKHGEDVTGYEFTVFNKDGSAYDLTGTSHAIKFYHKRYGNLFYDGALTAVANILTWTYKYADINLMVGVYYVEISFTNAAGDDKDLAFGHVTIL